MLPILINAIIVSAVEATIINIDWKESVITTAARPPATVKLVAITTKNTTDTHIVAS